MKKIFLKKEFFPKPEDNIMNYVGDVKRTRERFLKQKPSNLYFLLKKRFSWMNSYINENMVGIEVGSGHGLSQKFIKYPYKLTDFSDLDWIDEKVDALNMPYEDNTLDFIISSNMIHHLAKPHLFFSECKRVLKPSGIILVQEIYTSFFMRLILKIAKHEGYSYEIDPFDEDSICNDPTDLWSANCAVPEILFENERKFLEKFGFEIFDKAYSEFLIFPLSGGVIATKPTVNLPYFLLSLIDKFDDMLCKIAPKIFALQIRLVLKNMKKYD